jgi:hypothetical protein
LFWYLYLTSPASTYIMNIYDIPTPSHYTQNEMVTDYKENPRKAS